MKKLTNKAFKDARKYATSPQNFIDETLVGRIVTVSTKTPDALAQVLLVTEAGADYEDCYCLVNQENEVVGKIHNSGDPDETIEDIEQIFNLHLISDDYYKAEGEYQEGDFTWYCSTCGNHTDDGFTDYD